MVRPLPIPLLPEPEAHAPAVDLVKAPIFIKAALVLSVATPAEVSSTELGVTPSLEAERQLDNSGYMPGLPR